jgi:hypothetical protein
LKQTDIFRANDAKTLARRYNRTKHGGDLNRGRRKLERPLSRKYWIHVILKSDKAKGELSLLRPNHKQRIEKVVCEAGKKFGVKVGELVNVGNHLHLRLRMTSRFGFRNFLRSITAQIARFVTGARRGKPFGKFWRHLAFSRVLKSSWELLQLRGYFKANVIESEQGYAQRRVFIAEFNRWAMSLHRPL